MYLRKQMSKLILFYLITTLFLVIKINPPMTVYASSTTNNVGYMNASINNDYNWKFNILKVIDPSTVEIIEKNDGKYTIKGTNVVINTKYVASTYTKIYVSVNDVYVSEDKEKCELYDFVQEGNSYYTSYELKNLHTGLNTIRVRAFKPYTLDYDRNYSGPDYKDDTITVMVPGNINESIKIINLGKAFVGDYELLGINSVTSNNLNTINNAILLARKEKESDLTQVEIEKLIEVTIKEREIAVNRILSGQGTLSDYQTIGILNVNEENLEGVNWYLKEKETTESQIVSNVNALVNALNYVNNGTTNLNYYKTLGATTVTSSNVSNIKNIILATKNEKGSDLTRKEIETIILDLPNIIQNSVKEIIGGQGNLINYQILGITTVTKENLEDVNWYLKENVATNESQIKTNVSTIINTLNYVNNGTTNLNYYKTLGITSVTSSNANNVKASILIAKKEKGKNLARIEIINVVEIAVNERESSLKKILDDQGRFNDYQIIGMSNVNEENLEDVNWYLKEKKTVNESQIKTNVSTIVNALNYVNNGTTNLNYYKTLGITTVTSNNANNIKTAILAAKKEKGKNLTRTEIIKVVEIAINERDLSLKKILAGQGMFNDYQIIGISNVNEENLEDVNWYLKEKKTVNESQIKTNVSTIVNALNYVNNGTTNLNYYKTLGITSVTSSNANNVKASILAAKKEKGFKLTRTEIIKIVSLNIK